MRRLEPGTVTKWMGLYVKVYRDGGWVALMDERFWVEGPGYEMEGRVDEVVR
jgi:hypothetical protein